MNAAFANVLEMMDKESRQGYGDYAVFGGFSEFVRTNLTLYPGEDHPLVQEAIVLAEGYDGANLKQRQRIVFRLREIVGTLVAEDTGGDSTETPGIAEETRAEANRDASAVTVPSAAKAAPKKKPAAKKAKSTSKENPLQWLKNVGPKRAALLNKLGIKTAEDLLEYYPRRHEDRRQITAIASLQDGEHTTIRGTVGHYSNVRLRGKMQMLKAAVHDGSDTIQVVWFNQPWLGDKLHEGEEITIYGRADFRYQKRQLMAMEYLLGDEGESFGILPVYSLTEGLTQKALRNIIRSALQAREGQVEDPFTDAFREAHQLAPKEWALGHYHFPDDLTNLKIARRRLVFEEFFMLRLAFSDAESAGDQLGICQERGTLNEFAALLPYTLTGAQTRAINDIYGDMAAAIKMVRLLEGDVGSGKTVVAAAAAFRAIRSGHQAVLMAPTELLAQQHYASLQRLFEGTDVRLALLTGNSKAKERQKVYGDLADGNIDLIIGTHTLIQEKAVFRDLSLVIVDEQHRFGVNQREVLVDKGKDADLLILTATPIPRTLAMTIFADLSISVLDEMPPGRQPIQTYVITPKEEERALTFIHRQVQAGGQAYIVCPLVGESESLDLAAATELYERLRRGPFKDLAIGLIHGRMKNDEKEATMSAFRSGEMQVLVATTVIEVGVDVPNATVMLVRDAHRFGLAQLHQMRGRIGRGTKASHCILENGGRSQIATERLAVMAQYSDGFRIAEEDLKLRGPGDFFGTRQHGLAELKIADLYVDHEILAEAAKLADQLLDSNPQLTGEDYIGIRKLLATKYRMDKH